MMMFERESVCESERIHTHIQNKVKFNKKWTKIARVSADTTQSKGYTKEATDTVWQCEWSEIVRGQTQTEPTESRMQIEVVVAFFRWTILNNF